MPRGKINYLESIIYKLCCRDTEITDIYIGSTTNFRGRKCDHRKVCKNDCHKAHNFPVYQFIRANGGWDNWDMVEIEQYEATSKRNLHTRERYWLETLKATLNTNVPTRTNKEYKAEHKEHLDKWYKQYREDNKEALKEKNKVWRDNNKEHIAIANKEYNAANREVLVEYRKERRKDQKAEWDKKHPPKETTYSNRTEENKNDLRKRTKLYRDKNKTEVYRKANMRVVCECGKELSKRNIAAHRRESKFHEKWVESQTN